MRLLEWLKLLGSDAPYLSRIMIEPGPGGGRVAASVPILRRPVAAEDTEGGCAQRPPISLHVHMQRTGLGQQVAELENPWHRGRAHFKHRTRRVRTREWTDRETSWPHVLTGWPGGDGPSSGHDPTAPFGESTRNRERRDPPGGRGPVMLA